MEPVDGGLVRRKEEKKNVNAEEQDSLGSFLTRYKGL